MLCPQCRTPINSSTLSCANQHQFACKNGVLRLLDDRLNQQIETIYQHRNQIALHMPLIEDYNTLPYALATQHFEWRMRAYDADLVLKLLQSRPNQQVLEIGSWNNWLTHLVARQGHQVTAVDYFAHPTEGLEAKALYTADWQAIQMDVTDLTLFDQKFDVVIVNHGLHFFPDPVGYVRQAKQLLTSNGLLILIGLTFFRDPRLRMTQVEALTKNFRDQYGVSMLLRPTRGYMDFVDKAALQAQGVKLHPYRKLWRTNLKSRLIPTAPSYFYGAASLT